MTQDRSPRFAAAGLVLSLLGLVFVAAPPLHLLAILFGAYGLRAPKKSVALTAVIFGAIGCVACVYVYIALFVSLDTFLSSDLFNVLFWYFSYLW